MAQLSMLRRKTKNNKRKYKATGSSRYAAKYLAYRGKKRSASGYMSKSRRTGASAVTAPVSMGVQVQGGLQSSFTQKQMSGGGLRITGRSFITSVDTAGKYSNGLLAMADCNPVLLNDRVATIATTYEKYVYQSITYRYVPQCSTSTAGSVMLTFERDPANPAANGGNGATFMQNCMSYEHTAITPPWVGSSVTYKRDANEKKLFYISGQGSNYDPRATSQGMFMCYGANVPVVAAGQPGGGLGFIVMDYVLDLCEPSIMPARTGAGISAAPTNIPAQWAFSTTNAVNKVDAVGSSSCLNYFVDLSGGQFDAKNDNCIVELIVEGTAVPTGGNVQWAAGEINAKAVPPVGITLGRGSHLYLVLRRARSGLVAQVPDTVTSNQAMVIVCRNLADAIAALSATGDISTQTNFFAYISSLYPRQTEGAAALNLSGFYRQLTLKASDNYQVSA